MKKTLLFTFLLAVQFMSAQYYINEVMASPPGTDDPFEFIELRGPAGGTFPSGTYFVNIEGDGSSDLGDVDEFIDLSGVTIGANGYVIIVTTGHPYTIDTDATVLTDVYDNNFEDQSHTFMLVNGTVTSGSDVDEDDDGILDSHPDDTDQASTVDWTIYDSVSIVEADDVASEIEAGYGNIIFVEDYDDTPLPNNFRLNSSATIVNTGTQASYVARQGTSTGYAIATDWVCTSLLSASVPPAWEFSGNSANSIPNAFEDYVLGSGYGSENVTAASLSNDIFSVSSFKIYPNPANTSITIKSSDVKIESVEVFNMLGKNILKSRLVDDKLNVSELASGVYMLRISSTNASTTRRIVIN
ncbi:putative secreted protein (Por secretion system target) [Jejuia pallidilutea]|uniref:Putative secreted protein (Por secretion system target) n=1 Tax=Jejuia pallidilutea TaxID=504487 RepID=A0A362X051_9FLAO|nr:T9SS type A sorting domain-containing protein [Jejuia pallidilutea]PQV48876.1 putative secreted protein (Por secretion system target) [Jejuia pallidilutea]